MPLLTQWINKKIGKRTGNRQIEVYGARSEIISKRKHGTE